MVEIVLALLGLIEFALRVVVFLASIVIFVGLIIFDSVEDVTDFTTPFLWEILAEKVERHD